MVDKKNLNRIKGILSAKNGAEVPKFQNPAGPMLWNGQGNKEIKFHKKNGFASIYSNDGVTWFQDLGLAIPYTGSLDGYTDASQTNDVKPPLAIPGDAKVTPTTAVENAAQTIKQTEAIKNQTVAEATVRRDMEALPKITSNILPENKVTYNGPSAEQQFKETASAHMNLINEENAAKAQKALNKAKGWGMAGQAITGAMEAAGAAVGAKQAATDSDTTKTADAVYDTAAGVVENLGPVGKVVGTAMKFAGIAGDLIQEMGGGTDQQTKMDQWMDSSFFSWNIGMLNGFAGKNSDSFGVDQDTVAQVGSSYGGTVNDLNDAASKAGKKYGLFSSKARKKANEAIATAKSRQNLMGNIADDAADQRLAVQSMGEQAGLAYSMMTDGGYNQKYTYAAKQGGLLEWNPVITLEWEPQVELNWELPTFKEGGNIEITEELEWIPEFKSGGKTDKYPQEYIDFIDSVAKHAPNLGDYSPNGYKMFRYWELKGKPKNWEEALKQDMFFKADDGFYHAPSVAWNENGEGEWLKHVDFSTAWMEKAFYDGYDFERDPETGEPIFSDENPLYEGVRPKLIPLSGKDAEESKQLREAYDIVLGSDGYRKYVPKKFKEGGVINSSDVPETEETSQKNVIPEGALHKNKHHMEHAEGLTKKGIPVIDDDGEQQAEIEHSEIIFTLEVTKKLEEYYEIFYSDESSNKEKEQAAIDAGKLLVFQILENTEDRTGLIESCKKGGTITLKTTTDDLIDEVLEWMPTMVIVEEKEPEEKPKKKEEKSDKELMKEAIKEVLIELLTK